MSVVLEFSSLPSAYAGFARAAVKRAPGLAPGASIPRIEARVRSVRAPVGPLRRYRELCGFAADAKLPLSYPHVLAAPLHLAVLTHAEFPLKLLGTVHVRNSVKQKRALAAGEALDLLAYVEGQREADSGLEFDLVTRVSDASGAAVWDSVSTNLVRTRKAGKKEAKSGWTPPDYAQYETVAEWKAPADIGRRYGLAAGDINPIHLHALSAKAFGFPRAIAHGMWSFARCAAALGGGEAPEKAEIEVAFKRPLLLPGQAELLARKVSRKTEYLLADAKRKTLYLSGTAKL